MTHPDAVSAILRRAGAVLLGLLLCVPVAAADDAIPYRRYTVQDGLPHETVHSLAQGPDRRLWIGTAAGLAVYDGHSFRRVRLPDSLEASRVLDLLTRPSGAVWAVLKGEALVRLREGTLTRVVPLPATTNGSVRLLARRDTVLAVMRKSLWMVLPETERVVKRPYDYSIQTGTLANLEPSTGLGVADADLAPDGSLWVLDERRGLGRLSLDGTVAFIDSAYATRNRERWRSFRIQEEGALVTRRGQTYRVDLETGRRTSVAATGYRALRRFGEHTYGIRQNRIVQWGASGRDTYGLETGLPRTLYKTVVEDASGGLWVGTGEGLLYLPAPRARHTRRLEGANLRWVGAFGVDPTRGELWVASWGEGLFRLRPRPSRRVPGPSGKWTLAVDARDGRLHALSRAGWFRREAGKWTVVNSTISSVEGVVRSTGTGYFWTDGGLVRLEPNRTGVPDTLWRWPREKRGFHDFTLAPDGDILLRSYETLLRLSPDSGRVDTLATVPAFGTEGVSGMVVQNEELWMTVGGQGLVHVGLRGEMSSVRQVIPDVGAGPLTPVGDSLLFVGTKKGLHVVDVRTKRVRRHLTTADGLLSNNAYAVHPALDTLYVSHPEGLSKLPRSVLGERPSPPTTVLTRWNVNDKARPVADSVRLAADERTVSFDYTGVHLARGQAVRYAYRLIPRDTVWTEARQAFTRYTDLSPGTYRFEVQARLKGGAMGPPSQMTFTIPPVYYETAWFKVLIVLGGLALLGGGYAWRIRVLRRRQEKLRRMVDERTEQLVEEKRKTEAQAERLEALDAEKSRFFANISHELRTPLTILQGTLKDAIDGSFGDAPAPLQRQLDIMRSNVRRLHRLTKQLLDLARLETADPELDCQPGDLVNLLRRCTRQFMPLAERRGVKLEMETEVDTHPCQYDSEKMEKVADNLLSNALKNTPEGGQVRLALKVEAGEPPETILRVTDTGSGIPSEQQEDIFERFTRGGEAASDQEGTGIGLALVREYTELHDGTIDVTSAVGEGSTFTIRLPLPPADPATVEAEEIPAEVDAGVGDSDTAPSAGDGLPEDASDRPILLVVEDNDDVRAYLRRHLAEDYHLVEASDGAEGLDTAREADPDLVLTDRMMPEMGGVELCEHIRADDDLARTPVVLLTARAAEEDAVAGLEAGADAYVTKPFSIEELRARLQRLLDAHWAGAADDESLQRPSPDVDAPSAAEEFLGRVTDVIDEYRARADFTVTDLAAEVGLSPRQLRRKLKRLTGDTPAVFIRHYRLDAAGQLLENEAGTVSEIAYEVGFGTPETFAKHFEERFGCPPSQYPEAGSTDTS